MSTDEKEQPEPHQEADERLHGLVADRAQKNMRANTRHAQRGDLQEPRPRVEDLERRREAALHRRGGETKAASHARVPRLQVQASQEDGQADAADRRRHETEAQTTGRQQQQQRGDQTTKSTRSYRPQRPGGNPRAARITSVSRRLPRLPGIRLLLRRQHAARADGPHGSVLHHGSPPVARGL